MVQRSTDLIRHYEADDDKAEMHTPVTCDECGVTYQKPLFATVSSSGNVEKYYACPRCMTRVSPIQTRPSETKKTVTETKKSKEAVSSESDAICNHFVGYLRKRTKDVPIPDECLTCSKMVECMLH